MKRRLWICFAILMVFGFPAPAFSMTPVFHLLVNGEGTNTVTVQASPNTFTVMVEIRDADTGEIVPAYVNFLLQAFQTDLISPGQGSLRNTFGQTISGECTIANDYTVAENIYLHVQEASGNEVPLADYSFEIQVEPSAPVFYVLRADPPAFNLHSLGYLIYTNTSNLIKAMVGDANQNPIPGLPVNFTLQGTDIGSMLNVSSSMTDAKGVAAVELQAGSEMEQFDILATSGSLDASIHVIVEPPWPSATPTPASLAEDGIAYPNPAGHLVHFAWTATAEQTRILVYNLAGERVAEIQAEPGARAVIWDLGTIASGIYLYQLIFTHDGKTSRTTPRKIAILKH